MLKGVVVGEPWFPTLVPYKIESLNIGFCIKHSINNTVSPKAVSP